jgi:5'-deoxynucleotidase YfbR-like HD superfamily hydrolase
MDTKISISIGENMKKKIWIWTYTGKIIEDIEHPIGPDICIEDIAHSLAYQGRFAGHANEFYSVAQHSVLVARAVPHPYALWGLMHDASEAYLCDIPTPLKDYLSPKYKCLERKWMEAICVRFGLPLEMPKEVKIYDKVLLITERRDLVNEKSMDWGYHELAPLFEKIEPWSPRTSEAQFMAEFRWLQTNDLYEKNILDMMRYPVGNA